MIIAGYRITFNYNAPYFMNFVEMSVDEIAERSEVRHQYKGKKKESKYLYKSGETSKDQYKEHKKDPKQEYKQIKEEITRKYEDYSEHRHDDYDHHVAEDLEYSSVDLVGNAQ